MFSNYASLFTAQRGKITRTTYDINRTNLLSLISELSLLCADLRSTVKIIQWRLFGCLCFWTNSFSSFIACHITAVERKIQVSSENLCYYDYFMELNTGNWNVLVLWIDFRSLYEHREVEEISSVKDVWKWRSGPLLAAALDAPFELKVNFMSLWLCN